MQACAKTPRMYSERLMVGWPANWDYPLEYLDSMPIEAFQKLAAEGDRAAFGVIFIRYWNYVYQICKNILHYEEWSEEAAQDTFYALWKNPHKPGKACFATWLGRLAKWTAIRKLLYENRHKRDWRLWNRTLSLDTQWGDVNVTLANVIEDPDSQRNIEEHVQYHQLRNRLIQLASERLKGSSRSVLMLKLDGRSWMR